MRPRWAEARRLLCVRLDALGDVLMTTPALRALKTGRTDRRITLLASSAGAAAAALVSEVDEVIVYDAPWMKATAEREDSAPEYAMAQRLRAGEFDGAVVFTVFTQSPLLAAFLCYLAQIPLRAAHCRENPYQLLSDWVIDCETLPSVRHEVQRQLDLVAALGYRTEDTRLSVRIPPGDQAQVRERLAAAGLRAGRWVVIHPGASAASRRYPPEHFAAAARLILARQPLQIVFTGSAGERELIDGIRARIGHPTCSLAGELDLPQLAALIAQAPLLICNNSGPAHVAAAVGTPVVDLYALTNPQHTPWGVPSRVLSHEVPCRNCLKSVCPEGHHHCLRLVAPEAVAHAAFELLAETGRAVA
jgi:lipopolysaccharide heptosyltransferase II